MKSFKEFINKKIKSGRGGAADKRLVLYPKLMQEWCNKYAKDSKIKVIFKGDKVICTGSIVVTDKNIVELLPFKIDVLEGNFDCSWCEKLVSLEGAPKRVDGDFSCYECNSLLSINGAPETVGGGFNCSSCPKLKSLKGAPETVGGDFDCSYCNNLKSLEGAPKYVGGNFNCYNCKHLTSLKGAPKEVGGFFSCDLCRQDFSEEDVRSICKVTGEVNC